MATPTLHVSLDCGALGSDLLVVQATVSERISRPTRATVLLLSEADVDGEGAIAQPAHLEISLDDTPARHFHLVVVGVRFDGMYDSRLRRYTVDLAHEIELLTLRSDVRMFQEKNAQEIVSAVLTAAGVPASHVKFSLKRTPATRTYCVQYRETDFAFVSRLCEFEGIAYFAHDDDGSTHLTFADDPSAYPAIEGESTVRLMDDDTHGDGVYDFVLESHAAPQSATVSDYNPDTPAYDLACSEKGGTSKIGDWFEYPGGFQKQDEGKALAKIRLEELLTRQQIATGKSERMAFQAGAWFSLEGADGGALDGEYLITGVDHRFVPRSVPGVDERAGYDNAFTAIPHARPYRPPRTTPSPRIRGLHSAVVTGPSGAEIHTEEMARMKGKFFWDRVGKNDDKSSCWMRVGQLPIGGSMAIARVSWEMAVGYVDGDPDRPTAVARLYNAEKTSPYGYPAAKTRMSFQTPSSPASGKSNELRMEDGGGGMEMFLNASKDMSLKTINNKTEKVDVDEKVDVGSNASVTVGASETVKIGASLSTTVSGDEGTKVTSDRSKTVGASETVTVSGNLGQVITGGDTETVGGGQTTLAALGVNKVSKGSYALTVGGSMVSAAGMGVSFAIAGAKSETVGGAKIAASGASVTESIVGAYASTVGGVCVQAAAGKRMGATKGVSALTVGGLVNVSAAGKVAITAKKISIKVLGVANFLGGGGILNLTPASASFVGMVTLDASGSIKVSGNPNLVG
jgi:type VI secretion system secreted protein VgrG